VLVLGGGDGMAVREILKYPQVEQHHAGRPRSAHDRTVRAIALLRELNGGALASPKLKDRQRRRAAMAGSVAGNVRLRRRRFPRSVQPQPGQALLDRLLPPAETARRRNRPGRGAGHLAAVCAESFWTVVATLEAAGWQTAPYHALVPSFGEWGFILAGKRDYRPPQSIPVATRFVTPDALPALFHFPADMARVAAEPNRLDNQNLVRIFRARVGQGAGALRVPPAPTSG
jgi:spermidine synthase